MNRSDRRRVPGFGRTSETPVPEIRRQIAAHKALPSVTVRRVPSLGVPVGLRNSMGERVHSYPLDRPSKCRIIRLPRSVSAGRHGVHESRRISSSARHPLRPLQRCQSWPSSFQRRACSAPDIGALAGLDVSWGVDGTRLFLARKTSSRATEGAQV